MATAGLVKGKGASFGLPDYIRGDSSKEIHPPGSWSFAATRDKVINDLQDLHFSFGIQMLQT